MSSSSLSAAAQRGPRRTRGSTRTSPGPNHGYIGVPHDTALNPTSAITLEAWVFLTSYESWPSGGCASVLGKKYNTSYYFAVCNGRVNVYLQSVGVDGNFYGPGLVPGNQWVHVAATYDGATTSTYINGVLDGTTGSITGALTTNTSEVYIGADPAQPFSPRGALDEVRLWNIARTGPEIASTMETTITTAQTGLVAAWNMEGDGADALGNHNGSPIGDITFSSVPPIPGAFEKGDANCDNVINGADLGLLFAIIVGVGLILSNCTGQLSQIVDFNCSGAPDMLDALDFLRYKATPTLGPAVAWPNQCSDFGTEI